MMASIAELKIPAICAWLSCNAYSVCFRTVISIPMPSRQGLFFLENRPCLLGMGIDITVRKQTEYALHDSQAQIAGIFNSAMDAIITIDEDQKIIIFNPAAERM